jgi:hypothetical protein
MRKLIRVSQPSKESISSFDKLTGTVAALAAGLDPAEKEQVWNTRGCRRVYGHPERVSGCVCVEHG